MGPWGPSSHMWGKLSDHLGSGGFGSRTPGWWTFLNVSFSKNWINLTKNYNMLGKFDDIIFDGQPVNHNNFSSKIESIKTCNNMAIK